MKTNLIVDLSNITFVTHFSLLKKMNDFSKDYLLFKTIELIKFKALEYKVDGILIACDAPNVWRKELYPDYKAHRDELRDPYYDDVKDTVIELKNFFNEYTSIPAISVANCEADDIIYIVTQDSPNKNIILSSDKDFVQLVDDKTILYSPTQKKERESDDPEFDLFEKCIRGDRGDNIPSSYPNVRKKKLEEAFYEKKDGEHYKYINIMESTNKFGNKVKDDYERNRKLIDLSLQPEYIKKRIRETINNIKPNAYNNLKVLKFIGEHNLKGVSDKFLDNRDIFKRSFCA